MGLYQFSSETLWREFDELYPSWEQLRAYFHYVDQKLGRHTSEVKSAKGAV
jgi:hypothetical protein